MTHTNVIRTQKVADSLRRPLLALVVHGVPGLRRHNLLACKCPFSWDERREEVRREERRREDEKEERREDKRRRDGETERRRNARGQENSPRCRIHLVRSHPTRTVELQRASYNRRNRRNQRDEMQLD